MSTTGPVNPPAADRPPGRGPGEPAGPAELRRAGGSLAVLTREAVRAPFTVRTLRELLFCVIEVPLGLCVLAFPIALAGLPFALTLLTRGAIPPARSAPAHPAGEIAVLGGVVLFALLA